MENTTLVLTAALTLNGQLLNDDAFAGYSDDEETLQRLMTELWNLVYAHGEPLPTPALLVEAWYDSCYMEAEVAFGLCAG
jgi:hypothetical protein